MQIPRKLVPAELIEKSVATSGSFRFGSDFPAKESSIDQTRGCEHDLILGGTLKGSFVAYGQPLGSKMEIPIKTIDRFFPAPLAFSEVGSS